MKLKKIFTSLLCVLLVLCSFAFAGCNPYKDTLVIYDYDNGREYLKIDLNGNKEFSIDFIHSVNNSNVKEVYKIEGNEIVCYKLVYSAFGAGMPDVIEPPLSLEYDEDGNMVITGYNVRFDNDNPLTVAISIPYDHVLTVGDKSYSLGELVGHGKIVTISVIR